jgi:hypothetical protein
MQMRAALEVQLRDDVAAISRVLVALAAGRDGDVADLLGEAVPARQANSQLATHIAIWTEKVRSVPVMPAPRDLCLVCSWLCSSTGSPDSPPRHLLQAEDPQEGTHLTATSYLPPASHLRSALGSQSQPYFSALSQLESLQLCAWRRGQQASVRNTCRPCTTWHGMAGHHIAMPHDARSSAAAQHRHVH